MSQRTHLDYLQDIYDAAGHALAFVAGVDLDAFVENHEKAFAVTRALEIIGEAARRVPTEVQQQYPSLPWQEMIAMHNVVIHEYFGVNLEVIWRTAREDLPVLRAAVGAILDRLA
jgi:uncharacterized protein with HEPN domain